MNQIAIRAVTAGDVPFLWEMIYEAAFVPGDLRMQWRREGNPPAGLVKYVEGWGRKGDDGLIAEEPDGARVGAAWYRLFSPSERGEGVFAQPNVPEISIALHQDYRGRGIGSDLLAALMRRARDAGYEKIMLSVDPHNPALRLYERNGFVNLGMEDPSAGTSLMMEAIL